MGVGKVILLIFGVLVILFSFALLFGGGAIVWADVALKDDDGFISTEEITLERGSYAITTEPAEIHLEAAWLWDWGDLARVKVEGSNNDPDKDIFIGIAQASSVDAYLDNVEYDEIVTFKIHPYEVDYRNHPGSESPGPPTAQAFWTESAIGAGTQTVEWELQSGDWVLVLMNGDGSQGVDVAGTIGAKVPSLFWLGIGLLIGGVIVLAVGVLMVYLSVRR